MQFSYAILATPISEIMTSHSITDHSQVLPKSYALIASLNPQP